MKVKKVPLEFEDCIEEINVEINKRRGKWNLTALTWMDFDDVSQILRIHIYKKWSLYDPSRPLGPWINKVISSQIRNLVRNHYSNYSRPCLRCAASEGDDLCSIYTKQCSNCPLYAQWEKTKKRAFDTKLPLPLEHHIQEVYNQSEDSIDIERTGANIHKKMASVLKPQQWKIYKALYVDHLDEEEVARLLGYKTNEHNRSPGYKHIQNMKKKIMIRVLKVIRNGEIDIVS